MTQIIHDGAFHRLTIQPMMSALENLDGILKKAEAAKMDTAALLEARLYPDMFSLIQQLPVLFKSIDASTPTPLVVLATHAVRFSSNLVV